MNDAAASSAGAVRVPMARPNKWLVAASIGLGAIMGAIDTSIVNVALPQIRGAVGATVKEITWISTGYAIALVVVMPLTAFLGRLFGQKRLYLAFLALFIVGSMLCGMAKLCPAPWSPSACSRGLGAARCSPREQAILRQTFPLKEQGMAMALFGVVVMLGPAIGPTLGGYIVDHWHWSWIFFINLPIGLAALAMVTRFVQEDPGDSRPPTAPRPRGARLGRLDWHRPDGRWAFRPAILPGGGPARRLVRLAAHHRRAPWWLSFAWPPLSSASSPRRCLPSTFACFKNPVFASGTAIGALMNALLLGSMFLLPVFMQELLGFTAMQSGIALMPRMFVMVVAMPIVGRLYNLVSPRLSSVAAWLLSSWEATSSAGDASDRRCRHHRPHPHAGRWLRLPFCPLTTVALSGIPRATCSPMPPGSTRCFASSAAPWGCRSSPRCSPTTACRRR